MVFTWNSIKYLIVINPIDISHPASGLFLFKNVKNQGFPNLACPDVACFNIAS